MDVTYFLAQVFGLFFLIGGVGLVLKQSSLKSFIARFSSDRMTVMMGGFISLALGIPLVLIHNVWSGTLETIVSILVWMTFLKGAVRVLMPDMIVQLSGSFSDNLGAVRILLWLMIVLGGYLTYVGFGM
mgnify:CR=1 FL=1